MKLKTLELKWHFYFITIDIYIYIFQYSISFSLLLLFVRRFYVLFLFLLSLSFFFFPFSLSLSLQSSKSSISPSLLPPSFPMSKAVEDLIFRHRHSDYRFHLLSSHSNNRDMSSFSSSSSSALALPPQCCLQYHRPSPTSDQSNACDGRLAPEAHSKVSTIDVSISFIFFVLLFVCFLIRDVRSILFKC